MRSPLLDFASIITKSRYSSFISNPSTNFISIWKYLQMVNSWIKEVVIVQYLYFFKNKLHNTYPRNCKLRNVIFIKINLNATALHRHTDLKLPSEQVKSLSILFWLNFVLLFPLFSSQKKSFNFPQLMLAALARSCEVREKNGKKNKRELERRRIYIVGGNYLIF